MEIQDWEGNESSSIDQRNPVNVSSRWTVGEFAQGWLEMGSVCSGPECLAGLATDIRSQDRVVVPIPRQLPSPARSNASQLLHVTSCD